MCSLDIFYTYVEITLALTYNASIYLVAFLSITKTLSLEGLSDSGAKTLLPSSLGTK